MAVDPELVAKKTITVKYTDWGEYVYYASFIYSFGYRGAPTNDTNLRLRRVWADGQVIWFQDTAVSPIKKSPGFTLLTKLGTEDQTPFAGVTLAYRGQVLLYFKNYNLGTSPSNLPPMTAEFEDTDGNLTVAEVMETLAVRAGFEPEDITIEGQLDQFDVIGYILNSQSTLESVAADLGYLYDFSMTEYAGTITFRHMYDDDGDIIIAGTIPDGKLAVLTEGAEDQQYDIIQRGSDNSQPLSLTATYYDYDMNYDPGSQTVNRNSGPLRTNNSNLSVNISLPIVAHGGEIRSRLLAALYRQWEGKNGHSLRLPPEYLYLDAGDVAAWTSYGTSYTGQLVKVTLNADYSQSVSVNERTAVYHDLIMPTEEPSPPEVIVEFNEAQGILIDIPDVDEGQAVDGYLNVRLAVGAAEAGQAFYGARFDMTPVSQPNAWAPVQVISEPCLIGHLQADPGVADTVIVGLLDGMTLDRLTAAVAGDLAIIGAPGYFEIVEFVSFVDNLDDTATVTISRGLYGTDDLINTHLAGDYFIFYSDTVNVTYRVEDYTSYTQFLYRTIAAFQPITSVVNRLWVPQGNSRKPYSPNDFAATIELNGDITFTWAEDVRFSGEPDPVTYSLDIYNLAGTQVLRRFQNITSPIQTYFIEERMQDGTDLDGDVYAVVYQMNLSHVGRGFPSGGLMFAHVESFLAGSVNADPVFTGEIETFDADLEGTIDADPVFGGFLSIVHTYAGTIDANPAFIGDIDYSTDLAGAINVDPEFIGDIQSVGAMLVGTINVDPELSAVFSIAADLAGSINVDPEFVGSIVPVKLLAGSVNVDPELTGELLIDQYWSNVVALLHMDGSNGSTSINDRSGLHSYAATFNAQISTTQSVFGGASLKVDGVGDIVTSADSTDWDVHENLSDPFTIEFRLFPVNRNTGADQYVLSHWNSTGAQRGWAFVLGGGGTFGFQWTQDGALATLGSVAVTTATYFTNNQWRAIALDFDGTKLRLYIGGVMVASTTTVPVFFNPAAPLNIGGQGSGGNLLNGYMDEIRITKGVARYASDSGYTLATGPFPAG